MMLAREILSSWAFRVSSSVPVTCAPSHTRRLTKYVILAIQETPLMLDEGETADAQEAAIVIEYNDLCKLLR